MNKEIWPDGLLAKSKSAVLQMLCIIIDSVFLSLWAVAQYLVNQLTGRLKLSGMDHWTLIVFQIIFMLSTLAPVILNFYKDIRIMIIRVRKDIDKEDQSKGNSSNDNG